MHPLVFEGEEDKSFFNEIELKYRKDLAGKLQRRAFEKIKSRSVLRNADSSASYYEQIISTARSGGPSPDLKEPLAKPGQKQGAST